jgi:DNA-binding FadR family transcriptional regulator
MYQEKTLNDVVATLGIRAPGARALAQFLVDEMTSGRLRAGVRLPPERELSARFGASRGSVRRVLLAFRQRGLITQSVGSGTFASAAAHSLQLSVDVAGANTSPAELMEARLLIEPLMPALIVRNASPGDFIRMQECLDQSEDAQTPEDFEYWDAALHRALALATRNSFFLQVIDLSVKARQNGDWGRLKRNSSTPERRQEYARHHREIVDALRDRDAAKASRLLTMHLQHIEQALFNT